ncbi:THO complex subunit 5 homolog A [Octopus bimaculoides]|uniref:THO complex subunit 5 homolog A n=1 Tax=Octopus bimaculoides TaxID=37653 RepID=UPI0022DFEEEB|nr:THO complex subunit 5 homolog A [Octopus bimaculoides]
MKKSMDVKKHKLEENEKMSLFYAEEEEVDNRDAHQDLTLYKQSCSEILKLIQVIKELKTSKSKEAAAEIEEYKSNAVLQFVLLKKLNRLAHIRCKKVRESTNEDKLRIDRYHLQLQNLLYEALHLQKEITKCLEFKSKDEEVELVPIEEFYENAPEEISKPKITHNDSHQQTLARLDWELEQRKELSGELKKSQEKREKLLKEITESKDYLDSMQPKLNSILQATKPVQEYLNMPFDEIRQKHRAARHLPQPLYVLFMQASSYQEACDPDLVVSLEGDHEAARSLDMETVLEEFDSDSDNDDQDKHSSKHRRKTTESRKSDRKLQVLRKHPLSVILVIGCSDSSSVHLTFNYLLMLNIITVNVMVQPGPQAPTTSICGGDLLSPDKFLAYLYPEDHGCDTPNPANQYVLKRFGLGDFSSHISITGRPYLWAQWIAGLQFLSNDVKSGSSLSSSHMQNTIELLRRRIQARLSLLKQLVSLGLYHFRFYSAFFFFHYSVNFYFQNLPYCQSLVKEGFAHESDMFFTAVLERSSAKLICQVVVPPNYPVIVPMFSLCVQWHTVRTALNDYHVQEMESEVNVHYEELILQQSRDQILSNQLQRLTMCFDVYLETEAKNMAREGPVEISREKIYPRLARGPNRNKPFKYDSQLGIFTHR